MKAMLSRVGLNELLGFVRRGLSASPDLSTFDSIIQHTHRRMATQLATASTFDTSARLIPFKRRQPSTLNSHLKQQPRSKLRSI